MAENPSTSEAPDGHLSRGEVLELASNLKKYSPEMITEMINNKNPIFKEFIHRKVDELQKDLLVCGTDNQFAWYGLGPLSFQTRAFSMNPDMQKNLDDMNRVLFGKQKEDEWLIETKKELQKYYDEERITGPKDMNLRMLFQFMLDSLSNITPERLRIKESIHLVMTFRKMKGLSINSKDIVSEEEEKEMERKQAAERGELPPDFFKLW